jgi:hypothetical protein
MKFDVFPPLGFIIFYDLLFCVQSYVMYKYVCVTDGLKPVQILINTYAIEKFIWSHIQSLNERM